MVAVCTLLEYAALAGSLMRPEEVQKLMRQLYQPQLAHVLPTDEDDGEDPPLRVHRLAVVQGKPAPDNPINEPEPHNGHWQPRDEDANAERPEDEEKAERDPQQSEPERPDLPSEVRLQPAAPHFAPLHVVQNDRDDGRPAG